MGQSRSRQNASIVDYLFPKGMERPQEAQTATLRLPLNVGVAFVPQAAQDNRPSYLVRELISEERKQKLLEGVAQEFKDLKFVTRIETIPSMYLQPGGGFENLDQIARLFDLDVVALVSYDQMQFTANDFTSFAYWTIVGAYFIEAEKNDTQTLLDAVLYDVASHKMLFRAPGTSRIKARSTPINLPEELREDAQRGFAEASTNLAANLKTSLASFQEKIKQQPEEIKIAAKPGYVGGGSLGLGEVAVGAVIALGAWLRRRNSHNCN